MAITICISCFAVCLSLALVLGSSVRTQAHPPSVLPLDPLRRLQAFPLAFVRVPPPLALLEPKLSEIDAQTKRLRGNQVHSRRGGFSCGRPRTSRAAQTALWCASAAKPLDVPLSNIRAKQRTLTRLVFLCYVSIIVVISTLPATLAAITFDPRMASTALYMNKIVAGSSISCLAGKTLLGPVSDILGGKLSLQYTMGINVLILAAIALTSNAAVFGVMWCLTSFAYAGTWGAVASIIRKNFKREEWAQQLGYVAASSRLGSLSSSVLFGAILDSSFGWRGVFWASTVVQSIAFLMFTWFWPGSKPTQQLSLEVTDSSPLPNPDSRTRGEILRTCATTLPFWLMLVAKSVLMVVGQWTGFIPLFLSSLPAISQGQAATYSSVFAIGSLMSNLLGSKFYGPLSNMRKSQVIGSCLMTSVLCSGLLTKHFKIMPLGLVLVILSIWGLTWSLPFYIPPGVYALEVGGDSHAAFLTNVFDAGGFLSGAVFNIWALGLGQKGQWHEVLRVLTWCSTIAGLCMVAAMDKSKSPDMK